VVGRAEDAAGSTKAVAGCTKAVAGCAPTIYLLSSLRFIGQLLFWLFIHPTKWQYHCSQNLPITNTYETICV
jgi:mitochondrial fission protein ELM1